MTALLPMLHNVGLLAIAAVVVSALTHRTGFRREGALWSVAIGVALGLASVAVIMTPIAGPFGATFDSRAAPVVLAGFYGGPVAGGIAALLGGAARYQIGGPMVITGVASLAVYAATGMGFRFWLKDTSMKARQLFALALLSFVTGSCVFLVQMTITPAPAMIPKAAAAIFIGNVSGVLILGLILHEFFALMQTNRMLAATSADLGDRLEAETEASAAKSRFLANMSHELRTPLNAIIGLADVIRVVGPNAMPKERLAHNLDEIHANGLHLLDLVNDVLDLARIERNADALNLSSHRAEAMAARAVRMIVPVAETLDVAVAAEVRGDPLIRCDERATLQCLVNLLSNAVRHAPRHSVVTLRCRAKGDAIILEVADEGPGMPEELVRRIGEPFLTAPLHAAAKSRRGTGLGLAITQALAQRQGGALEIITPEGGGTRARIVMPRATAAREPATAELLQ